MPKQLPKAAIKAKLRVHGFRAKAAFLLFLLDREHRVWPMG